MLSNSKTFNLWFCCLVAGGCMILNGYDSSSFNAVQGSKEFMDYFHNPHRFFISAPISDYLGRRWTMHLGCAFIIISSIISTFTPRVMGGFIAGRALTGIGQGLAMPAGPVYVNEMAPAEKRGMIMSFWQLFFGVGSFLAYWINYGCTKNAESLGDWNWRVVILLQCLAPVVIITGLLFCPESPRWYIMKDRTEDAVKALTLVRDNPDQVQIEVQEIKQAIMFEKETNPGRYAPLWKDKAIRYRFLLACGINIGQQFTGQGSLTMYSTLIYKKVFKSNSEIQLINALNGTFGILFTLTRPGCMCMFIVAAVVTETPDLADGAKSKPVGIATVFLMFLFALFYKPSWGATVWIWTSEIFSMNIRAQAIGMATQSQSISNTILQQIFPIFLDKKGFYAMYMFGAINVALFGFVWFLIPETKGVALEHMDTIFGGVDHAHEGAEMMERNPKDQESGGCKRPSVRVDNGSLTRKQ
ncbi:general substrate transporter [Aspergillus germanicus]